MDLIEWTGKTYTDALDEFDREAQGAPDDILSTSAAGVGMPTSGGKKRRRKKSRKRKSRKRRSRKKSKRRKKGKKRSSKKKRR